MQQQVNSSYLYKATFVAALGGLLFGYDTAVIAGAIGFLKIKYELSPAMEGWVASCALIGCIIGAAVSGTLSDKIGRKKVLMICALLFAVSSAGTGMAELNGFIVFRIMAGIAIGIASMVSPMYISEIAPAEKRGSLVSLNQLGIVTGILVIYFVNAYIAGLYDEAWNVSTGWRWMFASGAIPSVIFFFTLLSVPESPRWLAKQGQWSPAENILSKINGDLKAKQEIAEIKLALKDEPEAVGELFKPGLRLALIIGILLCIFSQVTGINAIMYYAPEIFKATGDGSDSALLQTVLVGVVNLLFTFVAIKYVDKAGRKKLLLIGIAGMAICLLTVGAAFYLHAEKGMLVLIAILAYIAFFEISLGPLTFVVIAEIFPNRIRGRAMSITIFALWCAVFLVSQTFPILKDSIGVGNTFWIYMLMAFAAFVFVWKMIPETKGKTLEEIEKTWQLKKMIGH